MITARPLAAGVESGQGVADAEAMSTLAELVSLTAVIADLSEQVRTHLAARPTVTAHLGQARSHLDQLRRALTHAQGTLEFDSGLPPTRALRLVSH